MERPLLGSGQIYKDLSVNIGLGELKEPLAVDSQGLAHRWRESVWETPEIDNPVRLLCDKSLGQHFFLDPHDFRAVSS